MKSTSHTGLKSNDAATHGRLQTEKTSRDRYWRSLPDDTRETWAFLAIGTTASEDRLELREWHLATGNPVQLVHHHSSTSNQSNSQTTDALYETLAGLRENGLTLHTPTRKTVRQLRTVLLKDGEKDMPTLRGMDHIAVLALLEDYFAAPEVLSYPIVTLRGRPRKTSSESIPKVCWEIRTAIESLTPESALEGDPL